MTRKARIVIPGIPHHITQRGVRRQTVFFSDQDREYYLNWLWDYAAQLSVEVLSYCLMTNHVHYALVPKNEHDLHKLFKRLHVKYACYVNKKLHCTGHAWQARFFSAPLDDQYFWTALRYIERNPVRAEVVTHPALYQWSSAAAHCGIRSDPILTTSPIWREKLAQVQNWWKWLNEVGESPKEQELRVATARDLPCGTAEFLDSLGSLYGRSFLLRPRGRPTRIKTDK